MMKFGELKVGDKFFTNEGIEFVKTGENQAVPIEESVSFWLDLDEEVEV
jgi:hypothetical protein